MALNSNDYIAILDAVLQCIKLEEQQEAYRLINEKLIELNNAKFKSNADKQTYYIKCIGKLNFTKKKLKYKINTLESVKLQDTWRLLIKQVDEQLNKLSNEKEMHSRKMKG